MNTTPAPTATVTARDVAAVAPIVALPAAVLLDGSRLVADALAPVAGAAAAHPHLLLYATLAAAAVVTLVGWSRRGFRPLAGSGPFLVLLLSFTPGLVLTSFDAYSTTKVTTMLTVTPLLVVGALTVVDRPARRAAALWVLAFLGVLVAVLALAVPEPAYEIQQAVVLRGNVTISTARVIGFGAVALLCLAVAHRRLPIRVVAAAGAAALVVPLTLTGSRGPVVSAVAAAAVLVVLRSRGGRWMTIVPGVAAVTAVAAAVASSLVPQQSAARFEVLSGGPLDPSSQARVALSHLAFDTFTAHPLGLGWGDFGSVVPGYLLAYAPGREDIVYPHNLPLEVAVEGGLVALAGLLLLAAAVARAVWVRRGDPTAAGMGALVVYATVNALSSADINGNVMVWVFSAVALVAGSQRAGAHRKVEVAVPMSRAGLTSVGTAGLR
ncbi:O-antigen ligase family protein [Micromonospora chersina]|uniref:O-antigen ligase family protein n=1 Tax=Micromonospora chersina TaxID=47854 RepID=UPI00378F7433